MNHRVIQHTSKYLLHRVKSPLSILNQSINIMRKFPNFGGLNDRFTAFLLENIVYFSFLEDMYDESREACQQILALCKNANRTCLFPESIRLRASAKAMTGLARIHLRKGEYDRAVQRCNQALDCLSQTSDDLELVTVLLNLAWAYRHIGGEYMEKARETGNRTAEICQRARLPKRHLDSLNLIAGTLFSNEPQRAISITDKALKIADANKLNETQGIAQTYTIRGLAWLHLGDLRNALRDENEAVRLYSKFSKPKYGNALSNLGLIYLHLNKFDEAKDCFQKSLEIRKNHATVGVIESYCYLIAINLRMKKLKEAIKIVEEGFSWLEEKEETSLQGRVDLLIYGAQAFMEGAKHFPQKASFLLNKIYDSLKEAIHLSDAYLAGRINALLLYARLHESVGDLRKAESTLRDALNIAEQYKLASLIWIVHHSLARLYEKSLDRKAIDHYTHSVECIETLRDKLGVDVLKHSFLGDKVLVYEDLISLLINFHDSDEAKGWGNLAFEYAERCKSHTLIELMLQYSADAQISDRNLLKLRDKLRELYQRNYELSEQFGAKTRTAHHTLIEDIKNVDKQYEDALLEYYLSQPTLASGAKIPKIDVEKVQREILDEDTVMLEYFVTKNALRIFLFTAEHGLQRIETIDFRSQQALKSAVERCLPNVNRRDPSLVNLKKAYEMFLMPFTEMLCNYKRLVVIPHGPLHNLSFATLMPKNGQFVIDGDNNLEMVYAPSSTVLYHCRLANIEQQGEYSSLILADPNSERGWAAVEGRLIEQLFSSETRAFYREKATKTNLKKYAPEFAFIHFAGHGNFEESNPLHSSLLLAKHDPLFIHDLFDFRIKSKLVVLSACLTGKNTVRPGDELLGLSRGFFAAGASSLIASLWEVDQFATTLLMFSFYKNLRAGMNKAEALRVAQLYLKNITVSEILDFCAQHIDSCKDVADARDLEKDIKKFRALPADENPFAAPYFWGAFILIGDWNI